MRLYGMPCELSAKAAQHSCLFLPPPRAQAASLAPWGSHPGLSTAPYGMRRGKGLKRDCEAEPSLRLAKLSPGWHHLPPGALRAGISLGWHQPTAGAWSRRMLLPRASWSKAGPSRGGCKSHPIAHGQCGFSLLPKGRMSTWVLLGESLSAVLWDLFPGCSGGGNEASTHPRHPE